MDRRLYANWAPEAGSSDPRLGLCVHSAGHFVAHDHRVVDRTRDDHLFMQVIAGSGRLRVGERHHLPRTGDLCWAPPDIAHSYASDASDGWEIHYCHCCGPLLDSLLPAAGFLPDAVLRPLPAEPELVQGLGRVVGILAAGGPDGGIDAAAALYNWLVAWTRHSRHRSIQAAGIAPALSGDFPSVAAMAAACGLSRAHFSRVFRQVTGHSPWDWILHRRIRRARELLADPRRPIKQVARSTGFADPDHFCRVFKRLTGSTASAYRRATHAGGEAVDLNPN